VCRTNSRIAEIMARARGASKPSGLGVAGSNSLDQNTGVEMKPTGTPSSSSISSSSAASAVHAGPNAPSRGAKPNAANFVRPRDRDSDGSDHDRDSHHELEGSNGSENERVDPKVKVIPRGGPSHNKTIGGGSNAGELRPLLSDRSKLNVTSGAQNHPPRDRRYNRAVVEDDDDE
jgi:hypothetical protein